VSDEGQRLGPGALLARVRVERGLTPEDLAQTLNLSLATLRALEADDWSRLPSPIFVRGYLRAYARLLLVPSAPVLAAFDQQLAEAGLAAEGVALPRLPLQRGLRASLLRGIFQNPGWVMASFSALGALLLGGMVLGAGQQLDAAEGTPEPLLAAVPLALAPTGAAPEPEARVGADGKPELWVGVEGSRLELAYASESWTEVRDGADRLLYQGAPTPGTRLVVQGEGPFALLLGYAPGVRVSYNQMDVPLRPHTRNDIAQLVLGR
jgi:cytoskeleton protein RodZ